MRKIFLVLILMVFVVSSAFADSVSIDLIYPQKFNAPKRQAKKIEEPAVLSKETLVKASGLKPEQVRKKGVYIEYFLDDQLIFSTRDSKQIGSYGFILNTPAYPDGKHTLIANIWDETGPSAIGIRQIIIANKDANAN